MFTLEYIASVPMVVQRLYAPLPTPQAGHAVPAMRSPTQVRDRFRRLCTQKRLEDVLRRTKNTNPHRLCSLRVLVGNDRRYGCRYTPYGACLGESSSVTLPFSRRSRPFLPITHVLH